MIERVNIPRVMIVGTGSGCGKTTVTCALLAALSETARAASFKVGPDYIDPMFHREIFGSPSRSLDLYLLGEEKAKYLLAKNSAGARIAVIEGVMGMYDGNSFESDQGSSNEVSRITGTPEILVVRPKGLGLSVAAVVSGYRDFRPNHLAGVILNGCSPGMYPVYRKAVERETGLPVFGYLPEMEDATIGSRHLGLITAEEIADIRGIMKRLGDQASASLDIPGILRAADGAGELEFQAPPAARAAGPDVRIGVARDRAFCFYYEDALDELRRLGAEIVEFSPISNPKLPKNLDGLYFGGGYPELYCRELSRNRSMLDAVYTAVTGREREAEGSEPPSEGARPLPTIAECGGFMYLQESIEDESGETWPMAGVLPGRVRMTDHLVRFGYKKLTARKDNLLAAEGGVIPAHEFHYSDSDRIGADFEAAGSRGRKWEEIVASDTLFAGYPHIHLAGAPEAAERFIQACRRRRTETAG